MLIKLYEKNNNPKDIDRIVRLLNDGGIIICPTDTMYAFCCNGLKASDQDLDSRSLRQGRWEHTLTPTGGSSAPRSQDRRAEPRYI